MCGSILCWGPLIAAYLRKLVGLFATFVLSHHMSYVIWEIRWGLETLTDTKDPRGFASRDGPQISEFTMAGITSITATMTWLGSLLSSWLVWINQLVRKHVQDIFPALCIFWSLSVENNPIYVSNGPFWHNFCFEYSVEKKRDLDWRRSWRWRRTRRRFEKITTRQ